VKRKVKATKFQLEIVLNCMYRYVSEVLQQCR